MSDRFSARGKVTIDNDTGEVATGGRHKTRSGARAHAEMLNQASKSTMTEAEDSGGGFVVGAKAYPNEHAARIVDPGEFEDKSLKRKVIGDGVSLVLGKRKTGGGLETQSYRFDREKFTEEQAKAWLKKNSVEKFMFEAAEDDDKETETAEVKKSLDGVKVGARNNSGDSQRLSAIHDMAVQIHRNAVDNGATCNCGMAQQDAQTEPAGHDLPAPVEPAVTTPGNDIPKSLSWSNIHKLGGAIKAAQTQQEDEDGYAVTGQAVLFGDAEHPDMSPFKDFFTASTDFWLKYFSAKASPMIYDHGLIDMGLVRAMEDAAQSAEERDAVKELAIAMRELQSNPVVGDWTKATIDPLGLWVQGEVDKSRRYADYIKRMVSAGILRLSSDSMEHLIVRERQPNGTNEIKRWPLFGVSLTTHAAEPRLAPLTAAKSFFESLKFDSQNLLAEVTARGAQARFAERARQLAEAKIRLDAFKLQMKME